METVGDCYVVAAGLVEPDGEGFVRISTRHDRADSALRLVSFAKDALAHAGTVRMPPPSSAAGGGSNTNGVNINNTAAASAHIPELVTVSHPGYTCILIDNTNINHRNHVAYYVM